MPNYSAISNATEISLPDIPGYDKRDIELIVDDAIKLSINEIMKPVVNRVIPIALTTTKSLILKDFALESDPDKMERATLSTVRALASQLS